MKRPPDTTLQNPPAIVAPAFTDKLACIFLVAGSIIFYQSVLFRYAINAGQGDDMVDVLWFFEIFLSREQWQDWFAVIALPNHEHVTIFNHLVYLADYAIFRQVNFLHYIFIGHLIVLGCCLLFAEYLRKIVGWWYALAMAFGLFLNLFYWHASFWAITALSNQAVVLFALLAARSLINRPNAIAMPLLWSLLAVTTQFNGLLVLPALLAAVMFSAWIKKSPLPTRQCLVFFTAFVISSAAYIGHENPFASDHLWHYVNYTEPHLLQDFLAHKSNEVQKFSWLDSVKGVLTLFALNGASVLAGSQVVPGALFGVFILALTGWLACKTVCSEDKFWLALIFFALSSMGLIAIGRGIGFGPESGLLSRYRLYSFTMLILCFAGLLKCYGSLAMVRIVLCFCALVQCISLSVIDNIRTERDNVLVSYYNWLVDGGLGRSQMPFYPHNQDWRLFHAYQRGYYNPYEAVPLRHKPASVQQVDPGLCANTDSTTAVNTSSLKVWSKKPRALAVEIVPGIPPVTEPLRLVFCGATHAIAVTLDTRNVDQANAAYWPVLVLKKDLPPSQYRVLANMPDASIKVLGNVAFP